MVVNEFKTAARRYSGNLKPKRMLQATAYAHAVQQRYDEKPGIRYVVLVKTKKPQIQYIETMRDDADAAGLGDLMQAVERAIRPRHSTRGNPDELLGMPVLSPVPGMAGCNQHHAHTIQNSEMAVLLTELHGKGGRVCKEAEKAISAAG